MKYLWQNHYKALRRYRPIPYRGAITLFRGPEGDSWPYNDPELGWKDIAKGELRIIVIPARHHEFVESSELGIQFKEKLREAQDRIKKR
jgi:hypothetical protein